MWVGATIYREGQDSRPDVQIIRHAELALKNLTIAEAQAVAKLNGIRWSDREFVESAIYAGLHDIPPMLLQRVRKFENGGLVYPYGQHNKMSEVRATTPPLRQGMHQASITIDHAVFAYLITHPQENLEFLERHKIGSRKFTQEYYMRDNQDAISDWLMWHGINPRLNKGSYAKFLKSKRW